MLPLIVWATLAQPPAATQQAAVVQSSNLGVSAKRSVDLIRLLGEVLRAEGVEPVESRTPCESRACLVARGKELKVPAIISVAFAALDRDTVMDLECLQADGRSVAQATFTVRTGDSRLPAEAVAFARDVKKVIAPAAAISKPTVRSDTPVEPLLAPTPRPTEPELEADSGRSRTPAFVLGGLAIGAAAVAGTFTLLGYAKRVDLERSEDGKSVWKMSEAIDIKDQSNRNFTVGLVSLLTAVALAVGCSALVVF